ncbi:MAG: hypothetical protein WDO24_07430 [Pseudomonadota bacterium]
MVVEHQLKDLAPGAAEGSTAPMIQATDLTAFNLAAEQSGKPYRISRLDPRGWQLIHVAGKGTLLEMPDARTDFEAVKRAVGFLLSWGRL